MSLIMLDYYCEHCGLLVEDSLQERTAEGYGPEVIPCPECNATAVQLAAAPKLRFALTSVIRGMPADRHEDTPGMLDTRALGDGMPLEEWKAIQKTKRMERMHKRNKERFG